MNNALSLKIIIAGEGGQGVQTIAKILALSIFQKGLEAAYIPNFGVEQRGGVSVAFIQLGSKPVVFPKFYKGDIVVILTERSVKRALRYIDKKTVVIYNNSFIKKVDHLKKRAKKIKGIDATNIANKKFTNRVFNILILGAVVALVPQITLVDARRGIKKTLGYKFKQKPSLEKLNYEALEFGFNLIKK